MTVDPCFEALLREPRNELRPPPPNVSLERFRAANRNWLIAAPTVPLHEVEDGTLPGPAGDLPVRIYRPHPQVGPAIIYVHGGGFVLGDLDTHNAVCSRLAAQSGTTVVSVGYRLAPESPFPAPVEDCHAALIAVRARADALRIDATRVALAGDSAGANLALAAALCADAAGSPVRYIALLYPMLDPDGQFPSLHEFGRGFLLSADVVRWFWKQYLPSTSTRDVHARLLEADPLRFPPMSISTAGCDPLRDEGHALAERAIAAGASVRYRCYGGMVHGFAGVPQMTATADRAIADIANDLRTALSQSPAALFDERG